MELPTIKVIDVVDNEDGSANVNLELSDEFIELFCELEGLTEFSKEKFDAWFIEALSEAVKKENNPT